MPTSPADRRVLLFTAGVRLALRLSMVREVVPVSAGAEQVEVRGQRLHAMPLARALGFAAQPGPYAIITEGSPPAALRVAEVHGISDLVRAEVFQLPARTLLPRPAPFHGAVVLEGWLALELALTAASEVPLEPARARWGLPHEAGPGGGRELVFARGRRLFGVPISMLLRVVEAPRIFPVPLTPAAHRGLLHHERAIHPVFDLAVLYDGAPVPGASLALLLDAGGTAVALLADRMARAAEGGEVLRPAWDALFPA